MDSSNSSTASSVLPKDGSPQGRKPSSKNLAIQGLRGLAAFAVVIHHLPLMAASSGLTRRELVGPLALFVSGAGRYAVPLFFCISGFLIVQSLIRHKNVAEFARNRFARIYPLFGLLTLGTFIVGPLIHYKWLGPLRHDLSAWVLHLVSNLLFLPGVFDLPIAEHVAWSLSYEALFYVLASLAYLALRDKRLTALAAGYGLLAAAGSFAFALFRPLSLFFVVGIACYAWLDRLQGARARIPAPLGLIALLIGLWAFTIEPLLSLPFALIVFSTIVVAKGWLADFLSLRPLVYLGRISYSLYLMHPLVIDGVRRVSLKLLPKLGEPATLALYTILSIVLSIIVSDLTFKWIEIALTDRLFPKKGRVMPEPKADIAPQPGSAA